MSLQMIFILLIVAACTGTSNRARICDIRLDQPNGKRAFLILEVDHGKAKELSEVLRLPRPLDLRDYGIILHSGWGEPPESLKAELREKYGLYGD